ncbi:hypothetical protein [Actinomadura sp. 6N118]|uniref:hypothetical protein n=1 Tax=Actinomadura sp. 6N118 TaxID=3375151 RepID=UPI003790039A
MLNRRSALTAGLYSLAATALPTTPAQNPARTGSSRSAGPADIDRIRQMGKAFNLIDDQYGGGHARTVVAAYLTHEVAPLLRGTTGKARPALFTAAAEVTYLLGWMSADDAKHGMAQRYYIQAVRLAEEAGDHLMRATVLRSLSVQAIEVGHNRAGLELAEAAADGIGHGATTRKKAWITGMRAEALAARHNRHDALALLGKAETELEQADSVPEHEWTGNYRRESFEHQAGLTLAKLGDYNSAEEHYAASVATRRPHERRARALIGAELAHVQLRRRHPEHAARTLLDLKDDLGAVSSQRLRRTLANVRNGWRPFRPDPTIDEADRLLTHLINARTPA